jgi:hypothetical protein
MALQVTNLSMIFPKAFRLKVKIRISLDPKTPIWLCLHDSS